MSRPYEGGGTARALLRPALAFARRRRRALGALAAWSALESVRTFLTGYGVARALDDGFLAGDRATGLLWLLALVAGALAGGVADAGVFRALGGVVEPLRDSLVRRVVRGTLARAVASPALSGTARVSRLTAQTEIARDAAGGVLLTVRSFLFTSAGAVAGLGALSPKLLPLVLLPLAVGLALFAATLRPMAARQRDLLDADERLAAFAGEADRGARDIAACRAAPLLAAEAAPLIAAEAAAASALARWAAVRVVALGVAGHLPVAALLLAGPALLAGGLSPGELVGALTYVTAALLPAVHALLTALGAAGSRLLVVLDRLLHEDEDEDHTPPAPRPPLPAPRRTGPAPAATLRGVTFAYGPDALPVLEGLDLTVEPGERLLVVGPSGAGKSTLLALLAATARPGRGQIHLAGRTAEEARALGARARVLVPQDPYVFEAPLRENLTYLAPGTPASRVSEAISAFSLEPLAAHPATPLRPARLTPAERRRVALARAWLTPTPLLLLDEPTAHLDGESRRAAEAALHDHPATVITVTHHLAPTPHRILLLDGTTSHLGTHDSLLRTSSLYRDLAPAPPPTRRERTP